MPRKSPRPEPKVKTILIDPFKGALIPLLISHHLSEWHRLLDCDCLCSVAVTVPPYATHPHVFFVDDAGLLREPWIYPQWRSRSANGGAPIAGYGLLVAIGPGGETRDCETHIEDLAAMIEFERWEKRINPDLAIEQLLRLYLPGF